MTTRQFTLQVRTDTPNAALFLLSIEDAIRRMGNDVCITEQSLAQATSGTPADTPLATPMNEDLTESPWSGYHHYGNMQQRATHAMST